MYFVRCGLGGGGCNMGQSSSILAERGKKKKMQCGDVLLLSLCFSHRESRVPA